MANSTETRLALLEAQHADLKVVISKLDKALQDNTEVLHELRTWIEADKAKRTFIKWALALAISVGAVLKGAYWNTPDVATIPDPQYYTTDRPHYKKPTKWKELQN